ncbi:hypothetical protein P692DRAFT_20877431 [Suillus brevipes Sb2]|nr:hypothetical protein P692DRAFT_20877431 [Suillus brevipes Sb2]
MSMIDDVTDSDLEWSIDFVFSPDIKYIAAISEDGCLRVINLLAEQLVDCYASYFGSLTRIAWSPDGRFIFMRFTPNDLLTIFSPWEQRVVTRCQGRSSFVSAVAFDELCCDGRTYRFGSVGEDNKLILVLGLFLWCSSSPQTPQSTSSTHIEVALSAFSEKTLRHLSTTPPSPPQNHTPPPSTSLASLDFQLAEPELEKTQRTGVKSSKGSLSSIERKRRFLGRLSLGVLALGVQVVYLERD